MLVKRTKYLAICLLIASLCEVSYSQDSVPGIDLIDYKDLETHVSFLASPYLKGRSNGEPELEIALNYIVSQARRIGLKPAKGKDYLQSYCISRSFNSLQMPQYSLISCRDLKNSGTSVNNEFMLHNAVAWIEGCDPVLKSEYVVFSCHADHIGTRDGSICAGADDDASGCAALLEIAEAFLNKDKKPLRSIVFLWLTGEEIGLFGSQAYIKDPLFPLENTIADLNMDMIGRVKGVADSTGETPVSGPMDVFIIADDQSRDLMSIAGEIDKRSILSFDYSLSGRDNHLNLFARSDHFNFVKKDIPILFFTTGLHSDYHTPGDVIEKLDFNKLELVTKSAFEIGWEIANRKSRIIVDKPFTKRQ